MSGLGLAVGVEIDRDQIHPDHLVGVLVHAAEWGARTIEVGPTALVETSTLLPLPVAADEDHAPLFAVPPVALVAFALARKRGANPDRPDWIERYHSQGLRHILGAGEEAVL